MPTPGPIPLFQLAPGERFAFAKDVEQITKFSDASQTWTFVGLTGKIAGVTRYPSAFTTVEEVSSDAPVYRRE